MFGFKEEARLHLRLGAPKGRWLSRRQSRRSSSGSLSPQCIIRWVDLDPKAEICAREAVDLASMNRREVVCLLSGQARSRTPIASVEASAGGGIASGRRQRE